MCEVWKRIMRMNGKKDGVLRLFTGDWRIINMVEI